MKKLIHINFLWAYSPEGINKNPYPYYE